MVSLLGQFAVSFVHSHVNENTQSSQAATDQDVTEDFIDEKPVRGRLEVPFTRTLTNQDEESLLKTLESEERIAFLARLSLAWLLFIIFWVVCTSSACFCPSEISELSIYKGWCGHLHGDRRMGFRDGNILL